jgi:hypothetical protein
LMFVSIDESITGCDSAGLRVHNLLIFPEQVIPRPRMRPHPQRGQGWRKGGDHLNEKMISAGE